MSSQRIQALGREEVQETVLRHPERIDITIVCAALFAYIVQQLLSFIREHHIFDILPIVVFWGLVLLAILVILVWSAAVSTVVRMGPEDLTISWALGSLVSRRVTSVFVKDLTDVVARECFHGVKGRKTRGYRILFGPERAKIELLGRLTRRHVDALASGAMRGMLRVEH